MKSVCYKSHILSIKEQLASCSEFARSVKYILALVSLCRIVLVILSSSPSADYSFCLVVPLQNSNIVQLVLCRIVILSSSPSAEYSYCLVVFLHNSNIA